MERRSLPGDLAEDILSRVPAKSLPRLRSTSKQWNALSRTGRFAKMHSAKAPKKESLIITLVHSRVCSVRIDLRAPSAKVAAQFYLKDPLSISNSSQVDVRDVFHCDGLLLCTTEDKRLVVWNPCSGETKWVNPRDSYKETDYYALGYDNKSSCKKYKILRVDRQEMPDKNTYEIYDLTSNSNSWRVVGVATDWFLPRHGRGVSVKGNTYWVSKKAARPFADFLLSFDFATEMFQSLSLPHPFPYKISALSMVREEKLCLLGADRLKYSNNEEKDPLDLQVWVLTSTGSWYEFLAVKDNNKIEHNYLHYIFEGVSFVADEQKKVVMFLNINNILDVVREDKQLLEQKFGADARCVLPSPVLLNYVPSLAQIQQGAKDL